MINVCKKNPEQHNRKRVCYHFYWFCGFEDLAKASSGAEVWNPVFSLQSERSALRRRQPGEQTHLTHSLFHLNVCRADVVPGNKSYGARRYVLKVIAAEFQDTPADPQTLEMDYEILLD